jgi:hypothetical protein
MCGLNSLRSVSGPHVSRAGWRVPTPVGGCQPRLEGASPGWRVPAPVGGCQPRLEGASPGWRVPAPVGGCQPRLEGASPGWRVPAPVGGCQPRLEGASPGWTSPGLQSGEAGFQARENVLVGIEGFSPGVRSLPTKTALASARELGFVSGHDFSRAVNDWEKTGL